MELDCAIVKVTFMIRKWGGMSNLHLQVLCLGGAGNARHPLCALLTC